MKNCVEQIKVLQNTDLFITHCGMNSVNESLYYGVPTVLFPQHSEQGLVAKRVNDLGAGIILERNNSKSINDAVIQVMNYNKYKEKASELSQSFKNAGGAKKAADMILNVINSI